MRTESLGTLFGATQIFLLPFLSDSSPCSLALFFSASPQISVVAWVSFSANSSEIRRTSLLILPNRKKVTEKVENFKHFFVMFTKGKKNILPFLVMLTLETLHVTALQSLPVHT